jgi:hypothetical protein
MICSLAQYCSGDKIEKDQIGAACSAYGVWRHEANCLEDPDVNEDNIKMDVHEVIWGGYGLDRWGSG